MYGVYLMYEPVEEIAFTDNCIGMTDVNDMMWNPSEQWRSLAFWLGEDYTPIDYDTSFWLGEK